MNTDTLSKTDCYVVLFTKNIETNKTEQIGMTEIVWDSLNPKFTKKIELDNDFVEIENIILEV